MATIERYETSTGATRWRVRYRTPDRRQTDKRGFKTKRDAAAFAAALEAGKLRGEYVAPANARITLDQLGPACTFAVYRPGPSWRASLGNSRRSSSEVPSHGSSLRANGATSGDLLPR